MMSPEFYYMLKITANLFICIPISSIGIDHEVICISNVHAYDIIPIVSEKLGLILPKRIDRLFLFDILH